MGSRERIIRLKDETRTKILDAALSIAQVEGWQAVSLRKIANQIEYTAPVIYEYFLNKEGILTELTRRGYMILAKDIRQARDKYEKPEHKMEAMWIAYWNFAFSCKEFYRLMYGVDMICCKDDNSMPEAESLYVILGDVIESLFEKGPVSAHNICKKYYAYWSTIHGLVSINLVRPSEKITDDLNQEILKDAISAITMSINN